MKTVKVTSLFLALLFVLFAAVSCAGAKDKEYKTDVSVETLYKNAESKISLGSDKDGNALSFREMGALAIAISAGIGEIVSNEQAKEYIVRFTGGFSSDEYGIFAFKTKEEANAAEAAFKTYLKAKAEDTTQRSYYEDDYKFDESEVKVYGTYIAYAIMNKENRSAFFSMIDQLLAV